MSIYSSKIKSCGQSNSKNKNKKQILVTRASLCKLGSVFVSIYLTSLSSSPSCLGAGGGLVVINNVMGVVYQATVQDTRLSSILPTIFFLNFADKSEGVQRGLCGLGTTTYFLARRGRARYA